MVTILSVSFFKKYWLDEPQKCSRRTRSFATEGLFWLHLEFPRCMECPTLNYATEGSMLRIICANMPVVSHHGINRRNINFENWAFSKGARPGPWFNMYAQIIWVKCQPPKTRWEIFVDRLYRKSLWPMTPCLNLYNDWSCLTNSHRPTISSVVSFDILDAMRPLSKDFIQIWNGHMIQPVSSWLTNEIKK